MGRRARPRRQVAPPLRRPDRREFFSSGYTQVMPSPVSTKISRCDYLIGSASGLVMSVARKGEVIRGGSINQWIWSTVGVTRSITVSSRAALTLKVVTTQTNSVGDPHGLPSIFDFCTTRTNSVGIMMPVSYFLSYPTRPKTPISTRQRVSAR